MTREHELEKVKEWSTINNHNQSLFAQSDRAYLIDHDPVENYLYFAECSVPIRPVIMTCAKTRGIFRMKLNETGAKKEVRIRRDHWLRFDHLHMFCLKMIIDGRDYTSVQSFAIDWLHRNIYFVNTRLQTIDVCRLNGSFCHILLHQTISDYLPQRIALYPEKG